MTVRTITFEDTEWQVVPKDATDEMLAATSWPGCAATDYAHMLAAAPEPQVCFCDERGIGDPEKSCGDCPRDYGMPTVRAKSAQQPANEHADMLRELLAGYGDDGFSAERAALAAGIAALEVTAQQQDEQLPPYSAWMHVLDEAMVVRHLGVADPDDGYITAKRKLHAMFDWEIDVATDPAIGGDRVRKQQPMTKTELVVALKPVLDAIFANETVPPAAWEASVRNVEQFHGIGKEEPK